MAKYVDGFVLVVPKKKTAAYRRMAALGARLWMKYGALDYKECLIDDPRPKWVVRTFPKMAKPKSGETVWFSYIVYKSRAHRDRVNAKVMKRMMKDEPKWKDTPMPFDMRRMAYAGFRVVVDGKRR
jgi:alkaline phosphatase